MRFNARVIAFFLLSATVSTVANVGGPGSYAPSQGYNYQPRDAQRQSDHSARQWNNSPEQTSYGESDPSATSGEPSGDNKPPLPPGWTEHLDPNSGLFYYYNESTGETTWDRPETEASQEDTPSDTQLAPEAEANEPTPANESRETWREEKQQEDKTEMAVSDATSNEWTSQQRPGPGLEMNSSDPRVASDDPAKKGQFEERSWQENRPEDQRSTGAASYDHQSTVPPQQKEWAPPKTSESPQQSNDGEPRMSSDPSAGFNPNSRPDEGHREPAPNMNSLQSPSSSEPSRGAWGVPKKEAGGGPWGVAKPAAVAPEAHPRTNLPTAPGANTGEPVQRPQQPPVEVDRAHEPGRPPIYQGQHPSAQQPAFGGHQHPPQQQPNPAKPDYNAERQPPSQSQQYQQYQRPPPQPQQQQQQQQQQRLQQQQQQQNGGQYQQYQQGPGGQYGQAPGGAYAQPQYGSQGQYNQYGQGLQPPQQPGGGEIAKVIEQGTGAVKDALGKSWQGLLGFGTKTKDVVSQTRDQVVSSATTAGQSISERGTNLLGQAKSKLGGVFEGGQPQGQQGGGYSMNNYGNSVQQPMNQPQYQGYPGSQQPGRYPGQQPNGPGPGQQPPNGYRPQQAPQGGQQRGQPMQPRRDPPYPTQQQGQGQQSQSMQHSQYGNPPPQQNRGGYPPRHGVAPNQGQNSRGPGGSGPPPRGYGAQPMHQQQRQPQQQAPSQQQQQQPGKEREQKVDPWSHPGIMGDGF